MKRVYRIGSMAAIALVCVGVSGPLVRSASPISLERDGSLEIDGRKVRCGSVRSALDPRLSNLGISVPDRRLLVINPVRLARETETVRLFVFYHECGHHHVGGSELQADCWAVARGVGEGWLDRTGLGQVCRSFENAPETATHPSGARRCRNLDRCFVQAKARQANVRLADKQRPITAAQAASPTPKLLSGPTLLRSGVSRQ
jgi:hypothetical protein